MRFIQTYHGQVAQTLGQAQTLFETIKAEQEALGLDLWAPFTDEEEWGLVKWLVVRVGQTAIDEFMKLLITGRMRTTFKSKYTLLKAINKLPHATKWKLEKISVVGNRIGNDGQHETEDLELWLCNPKGVSYAPERVFADEEGKTCMFDEMWTGDWWWEMQRRLPQGAVVAPVILALDKTSLSQFCGDQEVWPVYLMLGNISKDIRCQPSKHAAILIAYLPISKLEFERYRLFHYCMRQVLEPLISAGENGVEVTCSNKQCLVACCMENQCPKCNVGHDNREDIRVSAPCNRESTLENLRLHYDGKMSNERFEGELGLQAIYSPFWATLPHNDIFSCITPDILHQLHKGVFKDHLLQWVFLGVIAGVVDNQVIAAVHAVLDFIYYVQYQRHTDMTLAHMHTALTSFHAHKNIFLDLGVRDHFNIPKVHSMLHYVDAIRLFRKLPEWLHIDFTKCAYHASN
ncbi:uncharacterized protein EDB93DRAFT_1241482 [Suillus bovinus]|uniref:uncharacterized protein n=1 Tax=Suillus bovinus TaxID=48563 RepID=UPI001B8871CE|nr:uncharacterized protein EDB93DRAFT_1241482 [Suillus bovinus]KAG2143455.1 hypothetical protein EDB93DRAFT_1241482 [Suillus bovinus]